MKIIKANQIIVGDGQTVINDGAVVINNEGKIETVGPTIDLCKKYPETEVINKEGCAILPGLIDMHVHIGYWWNKPDANPILSEGYNDFEIALLAYSNMKEALSLGVTTIRSVTDPKGLNKALKSAMNKKYINGPRLIGCEQGIAKTGGHGWVLKGGLIEADGPWEVRKAVRENIKNGADWIKAMASDRTHVCEYTQEELDAIVDESHSQGYKCCVHASTRPAAEMAIEAGFDTIEHGNFITPELAEKAKEKGLVWVPTLAVHFGILQAIKPYYEQLAKQLQRPLSKKELLDIKYFEDSVNSFKTNFLNNYKTGIVVVTGTDIVMPNQLITPVAEEIKLMCNLGLSPLEAIKCSTQNPARVLDMDNEIGTVEKGLLADLLIVEGNPLEDIEALKKVKEVYISGEVVYSK